MDKQSSERAEQVETLTPLLAVDDLFCERDERVLFQNLSFRLAEGQVLQIKGGNGSGKTTLLRILWIERQLSGPDSMARRIARELC